MLDSDDRVYTRQGGSRCVLRLKRRAGTLASAGFTGAVALAVDPSATPAVVGSGSGSGGGGR